MQCIVKNICLRLTGDMWYLCVKRNSAGMSYILYSMKYAILNQLAFFTRIVSHIIQNWSKGYFCHWLQVKQWYIGYFYNEMPRKKKLYDSRSKIVKNVNVILDISVSDGKVFSCCVVVTKMQMWWTCVE